MNGTPGFELHGLQKLFATSVTAVNDPGRFLFDPFVIREYVIAEVARIKHRLVEKAITLKGENTVRRYVRLHQYSIVAIMDKLFTRIDQPAALECCNELDRLLLFLEQHFPQYFDSDARAPLKHIHETRIDVVASYCLLEKNLVRVCELDPIAYIILDPLHRFCSKGKGQRVTFSRLRYLRYILRHGEKVVQDRPVSDDPDRNLIDLLLYLNYNSRRSFLQFKQFLRDLIPPDMDIETKIECLSQFLRIATQAMVKPNTGYHPQAPTLKSLLIDHLTAELADLGYENYPKQGEEARCEVPSRARFDLTVAQLGCLLRLLTDARLVSADNVSGLIRCVAHHCETKRSRSISPESLRIKFYEVDESTRKAVEEKLAAAIKAANAGNRKST